MKKNNFNNNTQSNINKYATMKESELMQEFIKEAKKSKENGSVDNKSLDAFYEKSKQFLNSEQQQKMQQLIDMVKRF